MKDLYVFGGRSTAIEIYDTLHVLNYSNSVFFVVDELPDSNVNNIQFIVESEFMKGGKKRGDFIIAMSNRKLRRDLWAACLHIGLKPTNIISNTAIISKSAKIGNGNYIAHGAIISSNVEIGDNNIINFSTKIGHDAKIGCNNVLSPGVVVGGNAVVCSEVLIGSNSFIAPGKRIGSGVSIDACVNVYLSVKNDVMVASRNLKIISLWKD